MHKNALMCNELDCENCGIEAHKRCLSIPIRGITEIIGDRVLRQKNLLSDMYKIQNQTLSEIFHSRKQLTKKYFLKDLSQDHMKIFSGIFKGKQGVELKGKQAQQFYKRLIKVNGKTNENANILLEEYRRSAKMMVEYMINLKNRVYDSFVIINIGSKNIDSSILRSPLIANLQEFKLYDSFIVNHSRSLVDELTAEQGNFMKKILNNPKMFSSYIGGHKMASLLPFFPVLECHNRQSMSHIQQFLFIFSIELQMIKLSRIKQAIKHFRELLGQQVQSALILGLQSRLILATTHSAQTQYILLYSQL